MGKSLVIAEKLRPHLRKCVSLFILTIFVLNGKFCDG